MRVKAKHRVGLAKYRMSVRQYCCRFTNEDEENAGSTMDENQTVGSGRTVAGLFLLFKIPIATKG